MRVSEAKGDVLFELNPDVALHWERQDSRILARVEHFVIFEKLVFEIISRILRILMEDIEIKNSVDSKPKILYTGVCSKSGR